MIACKNPLLRVTMIRKKQVIWNIIRPINHFSDQSIWYNIAVYIRINSMRVPVYNESDAKPGSYRGDVREEAIDFIDSDGSFGSWTGHCEWNALL